jgi:hypothetical protein
MNEDSGHNPDLRGEAPFYGVLRGGSQYGPSLRKRA